jgi:putative restriction endonuclease
MVADRASATVGESDWPAAVDDLVRAARSSRAVHRPVLLLYMLGRAQRHEPREVGFVEVEKALKAALATLGSAKKPDALLPFWHMQSSPFWEVLGAENLPSRETIARPKRTALLEARGALRLGWWDVLIGNDPLVAKLGERILGQLWQTDEERAAAAKLVGFTRP